MATYLYVIDLDERGKFFAHIEDAEGNEKWSVEYPEYYEDVETGEMVESSTIFEDGFMKDKNDISGLESYLKQTGVIEEGDGITDDEDEMKEQEDNNKISELAEEYGIPEEVVRKYLDDMGIEPDDVSDLNYYGSFRSEADFAESLVDDGVLSTETILYRAEMYDTDKRILAGEEADAYVDNASDDDILDEANMTDEYEEAEDDDEKEKILDEAKDKVRDDKYNEIYVQLDRDAVEYFRDMGYSDSDIIRNSSFTIDYEGLGEDLSDDFNYIEHDGEVYVFNNYASGGVMADGGDVLAEDSVGRADDIINASDPAFYGDGGNLHMLQNQGVELMHHSQELMAVLQDSPDVDSWVIAKAERAATDLSDIVHYLEGRAKMMMEGGDIPAGYHRMPDGTIMPDSAHMEKGGEHGVDKHRLYFSSLAEVIEAINDIAADNGYDVVEIFPDLSYGGISYGQTKKVKAELEWNGKEKHGKSKKREKNTLVINIYRMDSGNYELNTYFAYEDGGSLKEDFLEDVGELHDEIKSIKLKDDSVITHDELMEAHLGDDNFYATGGDLEGGGQIYKHKYNKGLTIKLLEPTSKGWKVEQTELYQGWSDKKLRKPKVKTAFYSGREINQLFEKQSDDTMARGGVIKNTDDLYNTINKLRKNGELNYATDNGVEYYVITEGNKAYILALLEGDVYMITKDDLREMSETARQYGIKSVTLVTNMGVEIISRAELKDFGIDRLNKLYSNFAGGGEISSDERFLLEQDGKKVKIDNLTYKIKGSEYNAIYPYKRKVADIEFHPVNKSSAEYKAIKNKLGDDWLMTWDGMSVENRSKVLEQLGHSMAGGGKVKFADKVKSIKKSLLDRKKVPPKLQDEYGKTYSPSEAEDSAKRIAGAQRAKEMAQKKKSN